MSAYRPDPPELNRAINMLRDIYWREYGRGWQEAVEQVKRVLQQEAPIANAEQASKEGGARQS